MAHEISRACESRSSFTVGSALDDMLRGARPTAPHDREPPLPSLLRGGQIRLIKRLGSGSMGTVYEATQEGYRIALKSLNRCSGEQIYRFKQEFRLLADVSHPHVIKVRELFFEDDRWFFTMELVDGLPIDRYVHGLAPAPANENTPLAVRPAEHFDEIRSLLRQLVEGVAAVHRVGLIHRDLKPSNVLVGRGGQLVILDFGLVSGLSLGGVGQTIDGTIAGTPGYLAPELALRGAVTPAGDWYAVGVILYELMTRQLPLSGTLGELLNKKATEDPLPPGSLCSDIPSDLNDLCVALLQRDPNRRPTTDQLLAQCRGWQCPVETPATDRTVHSPPRFVGRGRILQELTAAYRACAREAQFVLIDGASGLGKSALLSHFEQQVQLIDDPIILKGRCHERERVPYKGLDAIIDSITRMLLRLSTEQAAQLLPRRIACLARIFPALLRVDLFRRVAENEREPEEPLEQQRGAVEALREMFARLADQRPLVLLIDDLHWGDTDGLGLLAEVLAPPHAPRMLVVATRQTERPRQSNALSVLMGVRGLAKRAITLDALSATEARELASLLVTDDQAAAELIASESCGVGFLLVELVQHYRRGSRLEGELSLENLLSRRIEELSPLQRSALELVAVAGRPVAAAVLERALALVERASSDARDVQSAQGQSSQVIDELRRQKLITSGDAHGSLVLYHEGIARAALSKLDPTAVEQHCKTLISALLSTDDPDAESLALLFEAVGDTKRAAALTLQTAERAARALAFGYAADLYAKAVELYGQHALSHKLSLRKDAQPNGKRAHAQDGDAAQPSMYGHGNGAQASAEAEPTQVAQLAAQAALQWARSGHVRDGTALLKSALSQAGVHWPQTVLGTQLALGWRKRLARLRDAPAKLRPQSGRNPHMLKKLDALYPAYTAFGTFDSLRGAYFASRALPLARQVGDPSRLLNALTAEAIYCAMFDGARASQRIVRLRSDIRTVAARGCSDIPSSDTIDFASCVTAYWEGRWEQVIQQASVSEQRIRSDTRAGGWEANLLRSVRHTVQRHNGQFGDMDAELTAGLVEAREKRDLYALLDLSRSAACLRLAADDVEALYEAQVEVRRWRREYPATSIDYLLTSLDVSIALYRGHVDTARAEIAQHWRACRKSGLHRSPLLRVLTYGMRLDCALLDQRLTDDMRHVELRVLAKCIEREPVAWAPALAASARAAANALAGDRSAALRELTCSSDRYRTHAMHATSAGVLLRTGALLGGAEGDELSTRATTTLRDMNIVSPLRWTRVVHSMY